MARWKPNELRIEKSEHLGRRLFSGDALATGAPKWEAFLETRPTAHLSLDRLGPNVVAWVLRSLAPLCITHGQQQQKVFIGWGTFRAEPLMKVANVVPSKSLQEENPFHADLILDNFRNRVHAENLAHRLAATCRVVPNPLTRPEANEHAFQRFGGWCLDAIGVVAAKVKTWFLK